MRFHIGNIALAIILWTTPPSFPQEVPPSGMTQLPAGPWILNQSTMKLSTDGTGRTITYEIPSPQAIQIGVQKGAVFFFGEQIARKYEGSAHAFYPGCTPVAYLVAGEISEDNKQIKLSGNT